MDILDIIFYLFSNDELRSINGYIGYHLLQEEDSLHQGQLYIKII